jgi:protein involved in polysaccharide export with SLBB domain
MAAALMLALAPLLGGCAASGELPVSGALPVGGGVLLAPEHTLSGGDVFEIRFPFAADLNDRVTVGEDGTVAPKLIGSLVVGGLTVPEATARLKARYAQNLRDPELSLTIRHYAPEVFWIEGAVVRPGVVRSERPLTVARAVTQAGGLKPGAAGSDILVIRRDDSGNVRPYKTSLVLPAGAPEPLLKAFDVVYVPQTAIGSINEFMAGYVKNLPFAATYQIAPTTAPAPTLTLPQVVPRLP